MMPPVKSSSVEIPLMEDDDSPIGDPAAKVNRSNSRPMDAPAATRSGGDGKGRYAILDDFNYNNNVASANVYIRLGFLRKVYGILSAQLVMTTLVAALFMSSETVKGFVQGSPNILFSAMILSFVMMIALFVKRRDTPANYILLGLFTLVEAYTVGVIVTFYDKFVVLEAFGLTAAVTVALTVYTLQSKRDYSGWAAGLFAFLWIIIIAGFLQMFFHSQVVELGIAIGGAVVFSLFIVVDTSMMMHKLSPEEYILAAINLYLDILNLFLHLLRILSEMQKN